MSGGGDDAGKEIPADSKVLRRKEAPERRLRTLFVGNVPISVVSDRKIQRALKRVFEEVGPVESLRIRSVIGKRALPKKVACITGQTSEERDACNVFVVMQEAAACAKAEAQLNGRMFEGRHLRVDAAENASRKPNSKKSVFVGNLPHLVSDETLWALFAGCGTITAVRVIRDRDTGTGKGFGYVAFQERASLELALQLHGSDCGGRPIRVSKCAKPGYQVVKKERRERRQLKPGHGRQARTRPSVPMAPSKARPRSEPPARNKPKTPLPRLRPRSPRPADAAPHPKDPQHPAARRLESKLRRVQKSLPRRQAPSSRLPTALAGPTRSKPIK